MLWNGSRSAAYSVGLTPARNSSPQGCDSLTVSREKNNNIVLNMTIIHQDQCSRPGCWIRVPSPLPQLYVVDLTILAFGIWISLIDLFSTFLLTLSRLTLRVFKGNKYLSILWLHTAILAACTLLLNMDKNVVLMARLIDLSWARSHRCWWQSCRSFGISHFLSCMLIGRLVACDP